MVKSGSEVVDLVEGLAKLAKEQHQVLKMVEEHFVMNDLIRFMPRVYESVQEIIKEGENAGC